MKRRHQRCPFAAERDVAAAEIRDGIDPGAGSDGTGRAISCFALFDTSQSEQCG